MRVLCVSLGDDNTSSRWLTLNKEYLVLAIEIRPSGVSKLRVIADDNRTPILVDSVMFAANSEPIPPRWVCTIREGGTLELEPKSWTEFDFWERYFDGDARAVALFDEEFRRMAES
jgi:hypothetical protein